MTCFDMTIECHFYRSKTQFKHPLHTCGFFLLFKGKAYHGYHESAGLIILLSIYMYKLISYLKCV